MMEIEKPYLLHLLLARANWMSERVYDHADQNGYGDVTPAMGRMFAFLPGRAVPLSELARKLSVTRQAIHKLAQDAVALGYVELVDSEQDARAKLLRFTAKGKAMSRSAEGELILIERELVRCLGARRMQALKTALAAPWTPEEPEGGGAKG